MSQQQSKQLTKRQLRYQKDKAKKAEQKLLQQKEQNKKNVVTENELKQGVAHPILMDTLKKSMEDNKNPYQKFVDDMRKDMEKMQNGLPDNILDIIQKQKDIFDSLAPEQQEALIQKSENRRQPTEPPFDLFGKQRQPPFEALKGFSEGKQKPSALDELKNNPFSAIFKRENAGTIADILGSVSSLIKTMVPPSAGSNKLTMSGNTKDGSHVSLELNSKFTLDLARRIIGNEEEHHMQKV